jgi:hypothetical protein
MSTTVHEETLIEDAQSPPKTTVNHMTLRDVSAIEKETEMETDITNPDLSVSLLPFLPTINHEEEKKEHNKSIGSTISDKTFVKTSLKPFSSEEEEEEEEMDEEEENTVVEESLVVDSQENTRPLLLTTDQSIRIRDRSSREEKLSLSNKSLEDKPKIKQEKVSFREPMKIRKFNQILFSLSLKIFLWLDHNTERNRLGKTFLLNNNTFDAEKSDYVRPTIVVNDDTRQLSPIASAES